jgi:hypothetical protein
VGGCGRDRGRVLRALGVLLLAGAYAGRRHALLQQARQLQLGQPDIAVRIALDLAQGLRVQPLDEPLGEERHAVLAPQNAPLDNRALEDVGDLIAAHRARGEFLADDGQGRARGAADAEGEMASCLQPDERHSELGAQATGTLTVDDRSRYVAFTLTQPRQTEKAAEGQRSHPELLGAFQR